MEKIQLTEEQEIIHDYLVNWVQQWKLGRPSGLRWEGDRISQADPVKVKIVGGYAGTGKTFLITSLRKALHNVDKSLSIAFCSFTGKASSVLRARLEAIDCLFKEDYVGTIHSLIYRPRMGIDDRTGKKIIIGWARKEYLTYDLIIVDEASMVSLPIWRDLREYGCPIIAVGDHGQLPPIGEEPSVISKPDFILKNIHRQALSSPIIRLSADVRRTGKIPIGVFDENVFKIRWSEPKCQDLFKSIDHDENVIVLCATNRLRVSLNKEIRDRQKFIQSEPYPGERIICLKNNHNTKVMNGQLGTLLWLVPHSKHIYNVTIQMDNMSDLYHTLIHDCCFGEERYDGAYETITYRRIAHILRQTKFDSMDLFDFGYAISVHRSQGSEWDKVVLFEEHVSMWDFDFYKRWLYTAITRAREKLFVIAS